MPQQSLGTIVVILQAETAKFVDGLSKAAYMAQKSARDISKELASLQRVASQTFGAFGQFNPIISQASFALSSMASAVSSSMKEMNSLKGGIGAIAAMTAGAGAAMAAVGVGAIGMAMHAAEGAAKLHELSQTTGVSVEALSGLSFVAKQTGVSTEAMVTGLDRMSKSAFAAAMAPAGTVNAYTRLGISVKDSAGNVKSTIALFEELSDRFSRMPDGIVKTALAMQVFGRSGAELLPILDEGPQGIEHWIVAAQKLGIVISGETAERAHSFEQTLGELSGAAEGAGNQLAANLLPSLQEIASALAATDASGESHLARLLTYVTKFVEGSIAVLNTDIHALEQIGLVLEFIGGVALGTLSAIGGAIIAAGKAATFDFAGAKASAEHGLHDLTSAFTDFWRDSKKNWQENADFINGLEFHPKYGFSLNAFQGLEGGGFTAGEAFAKRTANQFRPDLTPTARAGSSPAQKDAVLEMMQKLQAQADAELRFAAATDHSTAAILMQKAAMEAEQKIADERIRLTDEERRLGEELANEQRERATSDSPQTENKVSEIQKRLAAVRNELGELDRYTPAIAARYAEIAVAREASSTNQALGRKSIEFGREIASIQELITAYGEGGRAIATAGIDQQLDAEREKVENLRAEYELLQRMPSTGIVSPTQGQGPSMNLVEAARSLASAEAQFEELNRQAEKLRELKIDEEFSKQNSALREEAPALERLNAAYLQTAEAVRAAQVEMKVAQFKTANPGAAPDQVAGQRMIFQQQSDQAFQSATNQAAAQYQVQESYDRTMEKLYEIRTVLVENGDSTLKIDAEIYTAQRQQIQQWDDAAAKVGNFSERLKGLFDEIQRSGEGLGEKIFGSMSKAIDDISTQLAKFAATGKSNFGELARSLEESVLKATFQKGIATIQGTITARIQDALKRKDSSGDLPLGPGFGSGKPFESLTRLSPWRGDEGPLRSAAGKIGPDGSAANPFYVLLAKIPGIPPAPGAAAGAPGSVLEGAPALPSATATIQKTIAAAGVADGSQEKPLYTTPVDLSGNIPDFSQVPGPGAAEIPSSPFLPAILGQSSLDRGPAAPSSAPRGLLGFINQFFGSTTNSARPGIATPPFFQTGPPALRSAQMATTVGGDIAGYGEARGGGGTASGVLGAGKSILGLIGTILGAVSGHPNLPMPPGFGSGAPMVNLMSLPPGADDSDFLDGLDHMEAGGQVTPGTPYIVGEKRPEIFVPNVAGRILPNTHDLMASVKKMGSRFGGYRVNGGDVAPGYAYITGEKQPELFVPNMPAQSSSSSAQASPSRQTTIHMHIEGVRDVDGFRRSQTQIMAAAHAQLAHANSRK